MWPYWLGRVTVTNRGGDAGWVDVRDPWDVTRAYLHGRNRLWSSGLDAADDEPLAFCPALGVRAGRYVEGEYTLTFEDLLEGRTFSDGVTLCYSNYDTHALDYANEDELVWVWVCVCGMWGIPLSCQIPYRCLVPARIDGLLVASRAISLSPDAAMAVRMQRDIQRLGEVAGVAAAVSVRQGVLPRDVDITALQQHLSKRNITLTMDELGSLQTGRGWPAGPGADDHGDTDPLHHLATGNEPITMAWWHRSESDILGLLGSSNEGKALWQIFRHPDKYRSELLPLLGDKDEKRRRAAAFALALSGCSEGLGEVIACVQRRDADVLPGRRTQPRWIGALALLALQAPVEGFPCMLEVLTLPETDEFARYVDAARVRMERPDINSVNSSRTAHWMDPVSQVIGAVMFALRYFHRVVDRLNVDQCELLATALERLIQGDLGELFRNFGNAQESIRWSLDIAAAGLLVRLGRSEGWTVLRSYMNDERRYVRNAARRRWKEVC